MKETKQFRILSTMEPETAGIWYSTLAYTAWGVLPLYWKLLDRVPALHILAHRIFWSCIFTTLLLLAANGYPQMIETAKQKNRMKQMALCGLLISGNWYTYIWAVNSGHVIEASMGYYINPLVVVVLGVVVLKERLNKAQLMAILFASIGVAIMAWQFGRMPWIALALAGSFALYGLTKKMIRVNALTALTLETLAVAPLALAFIVFSELQHHGPLRNASLSTVLLLAGAGVVTALPLLLFAQGAQRIKLSMVGFLQYIAPTISLFLGIFIFHESFSLAHLASFGFIWLGLVIFTYGNLQERSLAKAKLKATL